MLVKRLILYHSRNFLTLRDGMCSTAHIVEHENQGGADEN